MGSPLGETIRAVADVDIDSLLQRLSVE